MHITISIGVSSFPQDARDPVELIELADTALYHAKQQGRNRVSAFCYSPGAAPERAAPLNRAVAEIKAED
jgi:predicted signal transduction protein with EAL and GGDEF domain